MKTSVKLCDFVALWLVSASAIMFCFICDPVFSGVPALPFLPEQVAHAFSRREYSAPGRASDADSGESFPQTIPHHNHIHAPSPRGWRAALREILVAGTYIQEQGIFTLLHLLPEGILPVSVRKFLFYISLTRNSGVTISGTKKPAAVLNNRTLAWR